MKQKNNYDRMISKDVRLIAELRKSLFFKYFTTCASVILVCFIFLGTSVTIISLRYSSNQKVSLYQKSIGSFVSTTYTSIIQNQLYYGSANNAQIELKKSLQGLASVFSTVLDANVYIVNKDGAVFVQGPDGMSRQADSAVVPRSIMNVLASKHSYIQTGDFGGFFEGTYVTVASPVYDESTPNSELIAAVIISSRADNPIGYVSTLIRTFIVCIFIALALAFVSIYVLTKRLINPLHQMSSAAKSFAKGDFSKRVPVDGQDEVAQLAVAFNNMASSLTTLEDMRRDFVANVSHELKTPMTSIAGFVDGILDGTVPREKEEYYLTIVSNEVKRLSRLVRQFLDIARIEAGEIKINPSQFDVLETVRRVVVGFEYAIDEKRLEIKGMDEIADKKLMAFADPDLTHQIVYNLVDNAVKFANTGGYIEINVVSNANKIFVSVKNSGMGIPRADIPFVFERFYKTDKSRSQDRKGVGLGLYIAKTVLNMQNEDIAVKSVEGEYCEFVFTLKPA